MLVAAGFIFFGLGVAGVFLPLLPTTPFLLLAAACFARSSERFYRWLLGNRWFGAYVRNYREGRGVPARVKVFSIALLWVAILLSAVFVVSNLVVRVVLLAIAVGSLELAVPWMPTRYRARTSLTAITIAVVGVAVGLTSYWMPLGPGRPLTANLLFVIFMVAILMLMFWLFQHFYQSILAWCLRHKVSFLTSNVAFVLLGATAWLGVPTVFGWLPNWVQIP